MRVKRVAVVGCGTRGGGFGQLTEGKPFQDRITVQQAEQAADLYRSATPGIASGTGHVVAVVHEGRRTVPSLLLDRYARRGLEPGRGLHHHGN
ncbi:hypothetical protein [Streptomyces fuscichromogenes]|uniref:Uncharacterized protein n=1 Tax=Streptomyces fuscichromogenes TaxID=1324013 RepID=A0A918CPR1_9ACTN|nr:hypothetical protein [Streptomyces fuscichromogenes]GGM98152.1 hypothetical protein GCM10011578_018890 [Streptomyces fuscichromogenes]